MCLRRCHTLASGEEETEIAKIIAQPVSPEEFARLVEGLKVTIDPDSQSLRREWGQELVAVNSGSILANRASVRASS